MFEDTFIRTFISSFACHFSLCNWIPAQKLIFCDINSEFCGYSQLHLCFVKQTGWKFLYWGGGGTFIRGSKVSSLQDSLHGHTCIIQAVPRVLGTPPLNNEIYLTVEKFGQI